MLSSFDLPRFVQKAGTPLPPPASKQHTVSFLMSDGDNAQFVLGGWFTSSNISRLLPSCAIEELC